MNYNSEHCVLFFIFYFLRSFLNLSTIAEKYPLLIYKICINLPKAQGSFPLDYLRIHGYDNWKIRLVFSCFFDKIKAKKKKKKKFIVVIFSK